MSGGSYDYLCDKSADEIGNMENQLQRMADRLARLGYAEDAAKETMETLLEIRQAKNRIQTRINRLRDVWYAVEWWDSCDTTEDAVRTALAKYRAPAPIPNTDQARVLGANRQAETKEH
jgi:hypothetical protein